MTQPNHPLAITRDNTILRKLTGRNGLALTCQAQNCLVELSGKSRELGVGDRIMRVVSRGKVRYYHKECYEARYIEA